MKKDEIIKTYILQDLDKYKEKLDNVKDEKEQIVYIAFITELERLLKLYDELH